MKTIERNMATDHMNELQFLDECWLQGMSYAEYAYSAALCGKRILTESQFNSQCESNKQQADEYNK